MTKWLFSRTHSRFGFVAAIVITRCYADGVFGTWAMFLLFHLLVLLDAIGESMIK